MPPGEFRRTGCIARPARMHPPVRTALRILSGSTRLVALLVAALSSGCVTVYQPMASLQRPTVVDVREPNFEGMKLLIRCITSDDLPYGDAQQVCNNVATLFRNQGAKVLTEVPQQGRASSSAGLQKPELILDLRSRILHEADSTILRAVSILTWTLVPSMEEQSFAQDVTIRDGSGSLLSTDSLQSRFVTYRGAGVWAVNEVLDVFVRAEKDKLTGDGAKKDFSRDFYAQLSQLVFNARIRSRVLHGFDTPPPPEKKD